ncbi:DUF4279 domain-containing protein [Mucilaginibacter sp. MD40]|uniref:DUF4279 domain-containing protein n=1 Tax=Mucilaginibacter sp. MD40 TaxID=2029590 RepID=UPI00130431BD|nr:DUF4279 domain-containing protein [Mucilaginibacter sp. MD40]
MKAKIKSNVVDLRLLIVDFDDINHDEISEMTGQVPTYIRVKGQPRNLKRPDSPVWPNNLWSIDSGLSMHASFEDQMSTLLNIIEDNRAAFENLCSKYYSEFACAIKVYKGNGESTPWVHLYNRYNKIARELKIEFDVDLYAF